MDNFFEGSFTDLLERMAKFNLEHPLPPINCLESKTMTFNRLMHKGISGKYNLYILRLNKDVLYVGITTDNVWRRWFGGGISHMQLVHDYLATPQSWWTGNSHIGTIVVRHLPKSLKWHMEVRQYAHYELKRAEAELILTLRPLFNTTYRSKDYTTKELKLKERLQYGKP
jgi:hypothetical protein